MNKQKFDAVVSEAKEFIKRANLVTWHEQKGVNGTYQFTNDVKATGSLKRQSMELTRALAEFRRP